MATWAQTKGGVKDVQRIFGHSKADTTVNVYIREIEEGIKQPLDAIYAELTATPGEEQKVTKISHGIGWSVARK